ncbi:hypothetical protein JAAARDRAFT_210083 [Jaapia argillacea MUCL 33604]|uniref:DUF6533 domain-containing protein n=1 Tax=Jaapia argillacea MUCL 33604 TaxID=933084 RepID=A0A067PEB0_9AGAM|nr:hypothetical protein JAAARDRAFT_210083 [Jaapia argillacea MUCL 33604]
MIESVSNLVDEHTLSYSEGDSDLLALFDSYSDRIRQLVASLTFVAWDVAINIVDEIELIWRERWSLAKLFWSLARYLPLLFQFALLCLNGTISLSWTIHQCNIWLAVQAVVFQIVVSSADAIVMIRVYALYDCKKRLLKCLGPIFYSTLVIQCFTLYLVLPAITFDSKCTITSMPPIATLYWSISIVFDGTLFTLMLIKSRGAFNSEASRMPLLCQFVWDGTLAFILISLTMVVIAFMYQLLHGPLTSTSFTWLLSILSVTSSRLLLNPRKTSHCQRTPPRRMSSVNIEVV